VDEDCISRLVIVCEGFFRLIVFWGVPPLSLFGMLLALVVVGWAWVASFHHLLIA